MQIQCNSGVSQNVFTPLSVLLIADSEKHAALAREIIYACGIEELESLQPITLLIFYERSFFRMTKAFMALGVARSIISRYQLHDEAKVGVLPDNPLLKQTRVLAALHMLDASTACILGLPSVLSHSKSILDAVDPQQSALIRMSTTTAAWHGKLSALVSDGAEVEGFVPVIDVGIIDQMSQHLRTWEQALDERFTEHFSSGSKYTKHSPQLDLYWAEITMYSPFLHYLRPLAEGQQLPHAYSEPALRCLRVAGNVISLCESMLRCGNWPLCHSVMHISRWHTTWTIFLSTIAFIFLICVHKGINPPSEAWRKAETGIRLLTTLKCEAGGASRHLDVLKAFVGQVNHLVHFDFDEIERSTQRICFAEHVKEFALPRIMSRQPSTALSSQSATNSPSNLFPGPVPPSQPPSTYIAHFDLPSSTYDFR